MHEDRLKTELRPENQTFYGVFNTLELAVPIIKLLRIYF